MRKSPHAYELIIVIGIALLFGARFTLFTLRPLLVWSVALLITLITKANSQRQEKPSKSAANPVTTKNIKSATKPAPIPEWGPHANQLTSSEAASHILPSPTRARKKFHQKQRLSNLSH
ncbi:MAG TPA: hypothetical protein ACN46V_04575 [Prochlorococcus sp.]|tara:strand:- start:3206 stop:3562 length:357 start_codon:yes stop_codon:yes gene_type:complete